MSESSIAMALQKGHQNYSASARGTEICVVVGSGVICSCWLVAAWKSRAAMQSLDFFDSFYVHNRRIARLIEFGSEVIEEPVPAQYASNRELLDESGGDVNYPVSFYCCVP
ncbi:MAG: hypothetical protein WAM80_03360 [Candidatus Acidiferrales bacterium]